jgi:hypothetical protein
MPSIEDLFKAESETAKVDIDDYSSPGKVNMEDYIPKSLAELRHFPSMDDVRHHQSVMAHEQKSAAALLESLYNYYQEWSDKVPDTCQISIYAILANGAAISVRELRQEGFNGICIIGTLNGSECVLLMNQASMQYLCLAEDVTPEMPKRQIGFLYEGKTS